MNEFTSKDKEVLLSALNFLLKNEQNALQASAVIVPVAIKVQAIKPVDPQETEKTE